MLLWFLACAADTVSAAKFSDEDFYDESSWGSNAESPEETAEDADLGTIDYSWWDIEADIHLQNGSLNKDKSTAKIRVFSKEYEEYCSVVYSFEEALFTEPSFEEGFMWWRVLLKEAEMELQNNLCASREGFPHVLHIGVGALHVESLAVWSDVSWGDVSPPETEEALSAYISLDNGQTIWVYGMAKSAQNIDTMSANVIFLRPAYFFPF